MKSLLFISLIFASSVSKAALPPQFSECMKVDSSAMSIYDVKDIAKVAKVNYCQNQMGMTNKYDTIDLLKSRNVQVAISIGKTTYTREDLLEMAKAGPYLLYVDSNRIAKEYLAELSAAGVQLAVMSGSAGLAQADLMTLAKVKPYVYNVNSAVNKEDLKALVGAGVNVVIRSNQSGLAKEDLVEVAKVNPDLLTFSP
ncbi:MAG: hypothetical protein J7501_03340 [Bdellovibrio sp.]|nr:hypothetical protein [Bdellovibrio sp.]